MSLPQANRRLIARLDIKAPFLIKGVRLEGLRKLGAPFEFAKKYYEAGADELIYMDIVASLFGRNNLRDIVQQTAQDIFLPLTVGGGIRSVDDVLELLKSGADKVAVNTAAVKNPRLITEIAKKFGSQCMVLSVEAKKISEGRWEAFVDNGREHTGLDVVDWVRKAESLGAGEVLITSVDREGTRQGYDVALVQAVNDAVKIPVIASGGMGDKQHLKDVFETGVSAAAIADAFHYGRYEISDIRNYLIENLIPVRPV